MDKVKCSECGKELVSGEQIRCVYCELNQVNGNSSLSADTNCGICNTFTIRDKESLHCELCKRWYHNACNELALDDRYCSLVYEAPKNIKWFCDKCIWETEKWIHDSTFNSDVNSDKNINNELVIKEKNVSYESTYEGDDQEFLPGKSDTDDSSGDDRLIHTGEKASKREVNHRCDKCHRKFFDTHNWESHKLWHAGDKKPYKCLECQKGFSRKNILREHVKKVHSDGKPFGCEKCGNKYKTRHNLKLHQRGIRGTGTCHKNNTHSDEKPDDKVHLDEKPDDSFGEDRFIHTRKKYLKKKFKHQCDKCSKSLFYDEQHFEGHKLWHTGDEKPFKCLECGKGFRIRDKLKQHSVIHSNIKPYKCLECGKEFVWKHTFKAHVLTHSNGKYHYCDKCPKRFWKGNKFEKNLRDHLLTHSNEKPFVKKKRVKYPCNKCPKNFYQEQNLEAHKLWHAGDKKPFKCPECGKGFSNITNIKAHSITHSNEKSYICDICGMQLKTLGILKKHKLTHSSELPFVCEVCDRGFKHHSYLRRHMVVHNKIKEFLCPICGKGFALKERLYMHNKVVHTDKKPFECDRCGNKYKTRHNLNHHQRGIRGTCHETNTQKQTLKSHKKSNPSFSSNTNDSYSSDSVHVSQYNEQKPPLLVYTGGNNEPVAPAYSSSPITATIHCPPPALSVFTGQYMA